MGSRQRFRAAAALAVCLLIICSTAEARWRRDRARSCVPQATCNTPPCGSIIPASPRVRCPTGVPDLCPEDCSVIAGTGITYEVISTNRVHWYAVNGRQKTVRIYPLASSYQDGRLITESCWPYVDVPAMSNHFDIGETTWPTGDGPITGTGIRMYHSFELP